MSLKSRIIIVFLVTVVMLQMNYAFAGEEHPIDKRLSACIEKNNTTDGMNSCADRAYEQWDEELNKNYKLLMGILSDEEREQLKISQMAWIKFRDAETKFRMDAFLDLEGTMYTNMAMAEKLSIVSQRTLELKQLHGTLKEAKA